MIELKSREEIAVMRKASRIVAEVLAEVAAAVRPGVTTDELDRMAEKLTLQKGARPAFKGYKPHDVVYPKSLCVSVNHEIVHGIPSGRKLKAGDIVGLDFGVVYQGFFGDAARTVPVGEVSERAQRLMRVTRESLYAGIEQARVGNRIGDIGRAVQQVAEGAGYAVVEDFAGHGIGRRLHEEPQVPNYFRAGMPNPRLQEGMALAIEPMVNEGTAELEILRDGWTAVTADGKLSAHFEHSIVITANGPEILSEL
ncbi:MAG TPA: type I methionyl aminopeptidase [Candidatus Binataceae bacterium]|nr:type I methionyl aminopeptidase [Candidatus Binataceae bacterium]HVB80064.1 type I methionyl aminopeptidase [Candidatus Binataceae bacterium]